MSCSAVSWAIREGRKRKLPRSARFVLIVLADRTIKERQHCWPTVETIADDTDLSVRGVQIALRRLASEGLILIEPRPKQSSLYHLLRPNKQSEIADTGGVAEAPMGEVTSLIDDAGVQSVHPSRPTGAAIAPIDNPIGALSSPPTVQSLHPEPTKKEQTKSPPYSPPPPGGDAPAKPVKVSASRAERGHRLPEDWSPDEAGRTFAARHGLDWKLMAEPFRDYWHAASGKTSQKVDWGAAWRTWTRNELPMRPNSPARLAPTRASYVPSRMTGTL